VAALAYGDLPAGKPDLLTTEVLAAQRAIAPISRITVDVAVGPGDTGTARVRYDLGFATGAQTVDDSIPLVRTGRTWRLAATAVPVTIDIVNAWHGSYSLLFARRTRARDAAAATLGTGSS